MPLWQMHLSALIALPRLKIAAGSLQCRAVIFGLAALLFLAVPSLSRAQGVITTVAGTTWIFRGDGGPAIDAPLGRVGGVAVDSSGNLFVADTGNNLVVKVSSTGVLTVVAGNGFYDFSGDGGRAISASLGEPNDVALDDDGNLYIADSGNSRIRLVSPDGIITTVVGNGDFDFSGDGGPATSATLNFPKGVAVNSAGNIYIADTGNHRVRKVSSNGIITTVAGDGFTDSFGNGRFAGRRGPSQQRLAQFSRGHGGRCGRQPLHRRHR